MKTVTVVAGQSIDLGYQYDNYATEVVFPSDIVTPFITNFGSSGTFAIWYRRSGDALGYPIGDPLVTFDSSNNTITWQVVETDTENPGTAQVQLRYIIDEVCVMSQMFTGVVSDSVDVGEEVPEPLEQWADAIVTAGAGGQPAAVTLASQMTNTSKIYLYMGSEGGYSYNHIYYWNGSAWIDGGAYGGGSTGSGLTEDVKQALLDCFENVAWISDDGQTYVDALEAALYPPANLVSISAAYTQSGTVYSTDSLDSLKSDLVVTAYYDNGTSSAVTDYVLSGTLAEGTSTITVTYGGKTATFSVVVSDLGVEWDYTEGESDKISLYTMSNSIARFDSDGIYLESGTTLWDYAQCFVNIPFSLVGKKIKTVITYKDIVNNSYNGSATFFPGNNATSARVYIQNTAVFERTSNTPTNITTAWGLLDKTSGSVGCEYDSNTKEITFYNGDAQAFTGETTLTAYDHNFGKGLVAEVQKGNSGVSMKITHIKVSVL